MRIRWLRRIAAAAALAAGLAGCQDLVLAKDGELLISLATPHADDRAMLLTVAGPGRIMQVEAVDPAHLFYFRQEGHTVTVVLFGELKSGPLLRVSIPNRRQQHRYRVRLQEVVDPASRMRPSLDGYEFRIEEG